LTQEQLGTKKRILEKSNIIWLYYSIADEQIKKKRFLRMECILLYTC